MTDKFYVKLKSVDDYELLKKLTNNFDITILGHFENMPLWYILRLPKGSEKTALYWANYFHETKLFESAEPEFTHHHLELSNDVHYNSQWALKNTGQNGGTAGIDINVESAWNITKGSGIKIAIYDHGFQQNHPDLAANNYGVGYDIQNNSSPAIIRGAHATPCAGIAGAVQNNVIGVSGVAPEAKLISISRGFSPAVTSANVADGFLWAYQNGADIISCSWGGGGKVKVIEDAIKEALTNGRNGKGCVVVFGSGNSDSPSVLFPGKPISEVLMVGAISQCGERKSPSSCDGSISWRGSNYGTDLDLVAPGVLMPTTANSSQYNLSFEGTSSACPVVAGVAALVLSANPNLTGQQVRNIIERTARKVNKDTLYIYNPTSGRPNGDWNDEMGYGLVNAYEAVKDANRMDLYISNSYNDTGIEPDLTSNIIYDSPDIWIRNNDDNGTVPQNGEYHPTNPNYVYVKVRNRGVITSTANDSLELYWAKAGTALEWDDYWDGTYKIGNLPMGGKIRKQAIPILQPEEETIVKFEWNVPRPEDYQHIDWEFWHFCLLARIVSNDDPMSVIEINDLNQNVKNNNNLAWKNLAIFDMEPNKPKGASIYAINPRNVAKAYRFRFFTETLIFEEAEIRATLSPTIYNAWVSGGRLGTGISDTEEDNVILINTSDATIENVILDPLEMGTINLKFNFLTEEYTSTPNYKYYLEQRDMIDNKLLGGEAYLINTPGRDLFYADADGNKEANNNEAILLSATDIGEDAVYNWYDSDGNKVHQGKDYTITVNDDREYKLEITAAADGYRDYDNVTVSLKPNAINNISPNPTTSSTIQVDYTINYGNNAYIKIIPVYGASGNGTNYPVNVNQNTINIDLTGYVLGAYKVVLYCDGNIVESKNLLIN